MHKGVCIKARISTAYASGRVLFEDENKTKLQESLILFDSVVNSRWFPRSSIILLFNNVDLFKAKLAQSPLENFFPDYVGGIDINRATKYILWRFNQVNCAHMNLYPHLVGTNNETSLQLIWAAIKETIIRNIL
jgi:guanine nucleotide-binding protein G(i) subunit alpha